MNCFTGQKVLVIMLAALLAACTSGSNRFNIEHHNPATMVDTGSFGYTQVVTASHAKMIYLAGQGPTRLNEKSPPPEDLRGQAASAVDNVLLALDSVGAGPENIIYLRINVVDYSPRMLLDIAPELDRLTPEGGNPPASVFVGVSSLVLPSTRIEIETVAAASL